MGRRVAATLECGLGPAPAWRRNIYTSIITIIISIQFSPLPRLGFPCHVAVFRLGELN